MSNALNDLIKRCVEAELQYTRRKPNGLSITFSEGSKDSVILVLNDEIAEMLLEASFEKWRPIPGYKALWSPELGMIECELHHLRSPDSDFYVIEYEGEVDGWELLDEAGHETSRELPFNSLPLENVYSNS